MTNSSPDADIVLHSSDGTHFRFHSQTLRTTCDFFAQMFSLPQSPTSPVETSITLGEEGAVLERLLKMISGLEVPKWESYENVEAVLYAAEKYGAPGPISIIRSVITAPVFLEQPLRLYALAARFNWEDELQLSLERSLTLSIFDSTQDDVLQKIPSVHLLRLVKLHINRRERFRLDLDSAQLFGAGNASDRRCSSCSKALDNYPWRDLKARMCRELDKRPFGDTLFTYESWKWPEMQAFREAACACGYVLYEEQLTMNNVERCLAGLPLTV